MNEEEYYDPSSISTSALSEDDFKIIQIQFKNPKLHYKDYMHIRELQ